MNRPLQLSAPPACGPACSPAAALRVLLVDDDPVLAELLAEFIMMLGHGVTVCHSGEEALGCLRPGTFDLVFTDYRMPGMGGAEFYRAALDSDPSLAGRIVFVTGDIASEHTQMFLRTVEGPRLAKPFQLAQVRQLVGGFQPRA